MMREIKFRAWDNEKMNYGFDMFSRPRKHNLEQFGIMVNGVQKPVMKDEGFVSIMQYTGLKDKNGKDIYEGDIVLYTEWDVSSNENGTEYYESIAEGQIYYDEDLARFLIKDSCDTSEPWTDDENLEVIGNIWENPELLEDKR